MAISATTVGKRVYKIKHTAMQSPQTKNGLTEELSDIQCGAFIGCHLSNKSVHHVSALLELPWSTVSDVIVKWKCLSVATLTTEFQTASESNVSTRTVCRELHEMGFHVTMPSVGWRGVKLAAIEIWSSGMNHASPSGSPTDESGFGGCQYIVPTVKFGG